MSPSADTTTIEEDGDDLTILSRKRKSSSTGTIGSRNDNTASTGTTGNTTDIHITDNQRTGHHHHRPKKERTDPPTTNFTITAATTAWATIPDDVIKTAWGHYRAFLDSENGLIGEDEEQEEEEDGDGGDGDDNDDENDGDGDSDNENDNDNDNDGDGDNDNDNDNGDGDDNDGENDKDVEEDGENNDDGDNDDDNDDGNDSEEEIERCALDAGGGGNTGDIDELQMIVELLDLDPASASPTTPLEDKDADNGANTTVEEMYRTYRSERSLLPALLSMTYFHLGSYAISQGFQHDTTTTTTTTTNDDNDNDDGTSTDTPHDYLRRSLEYLPCNAAARSMLANYDRMNLFERPEVICRRYGVAADDARVVREGALSILRGKDDEMEDQEDEEDEEGGYKEWVELLLLDGVAGVLYIGDDDSDDDEEEEDVEEEDEHDEKGNEETADEHPQLTVPNSDEEGGGENDDAIAVAHSTTDDEGEDNDRNTVDDGDDDDDDDENDIEQDYSTSQVEATASFMAALLNSTLGRQDEALRFLRRFNVTHRIHPNVWNASSASSSSVSKETKEEVGERRRICAPSPAFNPVSFRGRRDKKEEWSTKGVLPPSLYERMCDVFAPSSSYWRESDYNNRGYYSFFHDIPPPPPPPTNGAKRPNDNLINRVVIDHLLPLVQAQLRSKHHDAAPTPPIQQQIVGFEWWAHTRPIRANLGHQLHFDTDETLLSQANDDDGGEKDGGATTGENVAVTHPIASSVLYLTGNGRERDSDGEDRRPAGSTVIFDQTPGSEEAASRVWVSEPQDNSFMVFPGDYLHGVLPCRGGGDDGGAGATTAIEPEPEGQSSNSSSGGTVQRLTFMVGFWTRCVPDTMEERTLYGPCGPLPPAGDARHTWVDGIAAPPPPGGGVGDGDGNGGSDMVVDDYALPCISPAWEPIHDEGRTGGGGERGRSNDGGNPPPASATAAVGRLEIPKSLDHRFFVNDPANFFRESLFKDESF